MRPDIAPVLAFLKAPTPKDWIEAACDNIPILLSDHANCEKKAASSALGLTYRYIGEPTLLHLMSRLAREELRHFEQVLDLMNEVSVEYVDLSASRYAARLHKLVRADDPDRLVDILILGAVVEARSCERFACLASELPEPISDLYRQLINSEARHFADYLDAARRYGNVDARLPAFLNLDAELVTSADQEFRFHSGLPT